MLKITTRILLLSGFLCLGVPAQAKSTIFLQKSKLVTRYSTSQFNDVKFVSSIEQDKYGFIWIAGSSGLFRFDGYSLTKYVPDELTTDSLPYHDVNQLLYTSEKKLWVGTSYGLAIYNEQFDNFRQVKLGNSASKVSITALYEDKHQNIWVGTRRNGVLKIDKHLSVTSYSHDSQPDSERESRILSFFEDSDGSIWVGTQDSFSQVDPQNKKLIQRLINKNISVTSIVSHKGQLLLGTSKGIKIFSKKNNRLTGSLLENSQFSNVKILSIFKEENGDFVIGTMNDGVLFYSQKMNIPLQYSHDQDDSNSLSSNTVNTIFLDQNDEIWIGSDVGVNKIHYGLKQFDLFQKQFNLKNCLAGNSVYAIFYDSFDNLWIGVEGQGLNRVDLKQKKCQLYNATNIELTDTNFELVFDIKEDDHGQIWISSYNEGLIKYDRNNQKFTRVEQKKGSIAEKILNTAFIYKILNGKNDLLWLAMQDYGIATLNTKTNEFKLISPIIEKALNIEGFTSQTIIEQDEYIWFSVEGHGLVSYNKENDQVKNFVRKSKTAPGIPENIFAATKDKNNNLWLGSQGDGLFKFNINDKSINRYNQSKGLPNNSIWSIIADTQNKLWIGTENGLSVYREENDSFSNFFDTDGLQGNDWPPTAYYNARMKQLWLGGSQGINRVFTQDELSKQRENTPIITEVKVNFELPFVEENGIEKPLSSLVIEKTQLKLKHFQNNLNFSFVAINHSEADRIKYQYKLENYHDWRDTEFNTRHVNYTNLAPGEYKFSVRASNSNGQWSNQSASIKIVISPPWWANPFAYIAYVITLVIFVFSFIAYRTRHLKKRSQLLEKMIFDRTEELSEEKKKVELLLDRKNEEFANISHEFRTPLTLILGPVRRLLSEQPNEAQLNSLNVIKRNGHRLLRLVNQLLDLETFRILGITQKRLYDTEKTTRMLTEAFSDLGKEKGVAVTVLKLAQVNCQLTSDSLEKILLNLLSNAIKYTPSGGTITIETTRTVNNYLEIRVSDSGIGIAADKLDFVFERYSRVLTQDSEQVPGAGIGLALVKNLVESQHGRIKIESTVGKGTTVSVYLPIVNETNEVIADYQESSDLLSLEIESFKDGKKLGTDENSHSSDIETDESPLVLVIEDNQDMQQYIASCIKDEYQVIIADDGEKGIQIAEARVPDLIISDIMMPNKDGYEVTKAIRENRVTNHIPIVLLTARGDRKSRLKGWKYKADEYLTKPFDVEELKLRLKSLIDIRNLLKRRFSDTAFTQISNLDLKANFEVNASPFGEQPESEHSFTAQDKFLLQLNQSIEKLYKDASVTNQSIADANHMSLRQLFRKTKQVVDMTPSDYLRRFRLEKAKHLLLQGFSVNQVALEVGFSSHSYFSKCFKAHFGQAPSSLIDQKEG
ncbi:two-component regulator propeller domain-containing protein [Aliikangiella sp. G2MR2-5]|uniref:hybrid sensor histidine kinase/response regulator transcription factor n=1 Tax=Aliikangiella sp. G2MR2-5 TaxID=2788943 RepID=UPI0018A9EEE7|nr:two-component regulator propeller domain-containing protein [Aliikangiella sp. G2MR2-5]